MGEFGNLVLVISEGKDPSGAKARMIVDVLRGAEAPLFHVTAGPF
jgi:hypothetical protein